MANHPAEILSFYQLTPLVDVSKSPSVFLRRLLFPGLGQMSAAETLEVPVVVGDRLVAPMVAPCAESKWVNRLEKDTQLIRFPRIALRYGLHACKVQTTRLQGISHYAGEQEILSQYDIEVADHQTRVRDMIGNRLELMVSQLIVGTMSYSDAEGDAWQYVSPKPAGNSFTAAALWTVSTSQPAEDILKAKRIISEEVGLQPTHMILGADAMNAFIKNESMVRLFGGVGSVRDIRAGNLNLESQFEESGAIRLGSFEGLSVWGYPRQVSVAGTPTNLIRPNYAEILTAVPSAMNRLYYGPIHNFKTDRMLWREFSHSWMSPDGKSVCFETESRPMPVFHKPGSHVSIQVTA